MWRAAVILLLAGGIPVFKWVRRRRRLHRLESGDVTAAWEEIVARLTDLGEAPSVASTPMEIAEDVDDSLTPLARVYSRAVYGEPGAILEDDVRVATLSLETASDQINSRYSPRERAFAWYRLTTLIRLPGRKKG